MWWTPEDREEFERRAAGLVEQYSRYEPVEGNFVNGELTLGENIGDLGGLSVAHEAYRLSLGDDDAPGHRRLHRRPTFLSRLGTNLATFVPPTRIAQAFGDGPP